MRYLLLLTAFFAAALTGYGQTPLPLHTIVTEDFSSLGSSATAALPSNWKASAAGGGLAAAWTTGTNVNTTTQSASSGTPTTGGIYNWSPTANTADRALGFYTTASYASPNALLAYYRNTTGTTITQATVAYRIERYLTGTTVPTVDLYYSTNGSTWTLVSNASTTASDFPASAAAGTFSSPRTITKSASITLAGLANNADLYFKWVFTQGTSGAQGLGLDDVSVFLGAPTPVISATLQDLLQTDNGVQNQFNEGDVIRYKTVIKNIGTGDATSVQVTLPTPPANTTMVAGSIKTSALAVDDNYTASFNTTLNATSVLANDAGIPVPTAVISYGPTASPAQYSPGSAGATDAGGTITLNANGTFSYTPPSGFSGQDQFSYITGNGNLPNNSATVSITVGADISFTATPADPACNGGSNGSITFAATGGNGTLQYSINNGTTYQASNTFTGLSAGTYQLAVKDAGGLVRTSTVTLNNPAAIVVSGGIGNQTYGTAMTSATFTKTGGTGAISWSATGLPTGITIGSSTGTVSGTPTQTGSFSAVITATDAGGCTGSKTVSFTVAPKITADSYAAVGNTQLVAAGHSAPATPYTASGTALTANDASDAAISVTAASSAATSLGGTITIDASGKFTYTPPVGVSSGTDTYTYTATSNGVSATATISIAISGMVWYVNNTYAGANGASNGLSNRPFTDLTTATTAAQSGQIIYVHTGSGSTTGNAVLKSSQILRGAGSALSVGALSIAAGTRPVLSGTVTLANSVTVDGLDMSTGTATALASSGATGVSVSINNITTSGAATAVSLTNTTGSISITTGSLTGGGGTVFNISGGSASVSCGASITQSTAGQRLISVQTITGGTVSFSGNLSSTGTSTGILVNGNTGGTINFSGTSKTLSTGTNTAITLTTNTGATINFTGGGLAVTTSSGNGFNATGGGTVSVQGSNNIVNSGTGVAVNVQNTNISSGNLVFKSIFANGGANGIYLQNTGASGGLQVTGDGSSWPSGGIVQNAVGADGAIAGNGIYLNNTRNVSLSFMQLAGHQNNAIYGTSVTNFDVYRTRFTGNNGTSNSGAYQEADIQLVSCGGGITVKNSRLDGAAYDAFLLNNVSGTAPVVDSLALAMDSVTTMQGSTADVRNTALQALFADGSADVRMRDNYLLFWWGSAIQVGVRSTASAIATITGNFISNTNGALAGAGGIEVNGGALTYTISNNTVQYSNGTAISADKGAYNVLMTGVISNNVIGISGVANSGSAAGTGIYVNHAGAGETRVTISNNTIRQINGSQAIWALEGDDTGSGGSGTMNVTITGNDIQEAGTAANSARMGILVTVGSATGDNDIGCFNIGGAGALANSITNFNTAAGGTSVNRLRVNQRFLTTARFPGYTGANNDNTALGNYLLSRNVASNYVNSNNVSAGGPGFTNTPGGVPCTQ